MSVDFKTLKSKVGIDDVAYKLGYRINKAAGLGRYIEMMLPDGSDKIVIKNPQDKAHQTYFRHNGQKGGDVVSFVLEHLNQFNHRSSNQWAAVTEILADFSQTYIEETSKYIAKAGYKGAQPFVAKRYDTKPVTEDLERVTKLLSSRGFTESTIQVFSGNMTLLKDTYNKQFDKYNIAFPYTRPYSNEIVGYEIRGYNGFKSKAAGTDSNTAAWIVDLSDDKNPQSKQHVFFAESAFDIMAFYQANKSQLDLNSSVFVSIGGTFSDNQIKSIMHHYSNAIAVDCFDNDLAGKIYGIRMLALLNDAKFESRRDESTDSLHIKLNGIEKIYSEKTISPAKVANDYHLSTKISRWKAPLKFKDWNDLVQNKPLQRHNKYEQANNLRQTRLKR